MIKDDAAEFEQREVSNLLIGYQRETTADKRKQWVLLNNSEVCWSLFRLSAELTQADRQITEEESEFMHETGATASSVCDK